MLKKLFILLFSVGLLFALEKEPFASQNNYETSFKQAVEKAQKANKGVYVFMIESYCPWCKKMAREVLSKESVNKALHKNFVPVVIMRDVDIYPKNYTVPGVPGHFFIDANNLDKFTRLVGYQKETAFKYIIEQNSH